MVIEKKLTSVITPFLTNHGMCNQFRILLGIEPTVYRCITKSRTDSIMSYGMYSEPIFFFLVCLKHVKNDDEPVQHQLIGETSFQTNPSTCQ